MKKATFCPTCRGCELHNSFKRDIKEDEELDYYICGDLIEHDEVSAFTKVLGFIEHIQEKSKEYRCCIDFVPGNHDLINGSFDDFDLF